MPSRSYTVNDLPKFSPWTARLLGLTDWDPKEKNPEEITREFDREKWGALLARVTDRTLRPTIDEAEDFADKGSRAGLCSVGEDLRYLEPAESRGAYFDLIQETLSPFSEAPALVELGAGYGRVLLRLGQTERFRHARLFGAEYTSSGRELLGLLAKGSGLSDVSVGWADFSMNPMTDLVIPKGALIFTSYASHYVRELGADFVAQLSRFEPRAVVQFEPCLEHCDGSTVLGLLRQKYILANDYNRNLVTVLKSQAQAGKIELLAERPAVFGGNPLLPASVLIWQPTRETA